MNHSYPPSMSKTCGPVARMASFAVLSMFGLTSLPTRAEPGNVQSLCGADEETVFACRMQTNKKIVSLCATQASTGARRFYYAYGRPSSVELRYPSGEPRSNAFSRTHLGFMGNTGGYAYGFKNGAYKYILYSVSGARGYEESGLIVQRDGNIRALQDMHCQQSSVVETESDLTLKATYQWSHDPDIESTGLPSLR